MNVFRLRMSNMRVLFLRFLQKCLEGFRKLLPAIGLGIINTFTLLFLIMWIAS